MKKIRVLQVVGRMNPAGIENFVMNLFRNIDRDKFQFDFLYITEEKCFFDDEILSLGGNIFRISGRSDGLVKHIKDLKRFFKENKDIDVVHIHACTALCLTDAFLAKQAGIKKVFVHSHSAKAPHAIIHNILKKILPCYTTKMLTCSDTAAKWMFPKKSVDTNQALTILNGVNPTKYIYNEQTDKKIRQTYNLEGKFVIGHTGRMEEKKNHTFLIDILNETIKIVPNAALLLVGDGPLRGELEAKVHSLGLEDKVIFAGICGNVDEMLQCMDVFVFPSIHEGLPVSMVESQCAGLLCFVSDTLTKELQITKRTTYLPLEYGAKKWADIIISKYNENPRRSDETESITEAGFNINNTVELLSRLYSESDE